MTVPKPGPGLARPGSDSYLGDRSTRHGGYWRWCRERSADGRCAVKAEIFKHLDAIEGQEQFLAKAMWDRMTRDATRGRLRFGERLDVVDIQRAPHLLEMRLQIASGLDVKVVQRCVRHASAKTTLDTYGHMFPDKEESARAAVSEVLKDRALQMRSAVIED